VVVGCETTARTPIATVRDEIDAPAFPPAPPAVPPPPGIRRFLDADQARAVTAIVGRLLPGTPDDPGAVEIGVPTYIDHKLAEFEAFAEPTYQQGPFAKTYEGSRPTDVPPGKVPVEKSDAERYGFQSSLTPQQIYRKGLVALDAYCRSSAGAAFADLAPAQQDGVLMALEDNKASGFDEPSAKLFFKTLHGDTVEGLFADPVYGGNRDLAGWKLIGYPGAQRSYSPSELKRGTHRPQQALLTLAPTHPGVHANGHVEVPTMEPMEGVH
jgi:gluconate 2-dehydrogenase gamma chain